MKFRVPVQPFVDQHTRRAVHLRLFACVCDQVEHGPIRFEHFSQSLRGLIVDL